VGLLTWLLWLGAGANLLFRPTYFSESTSSALWLGGWWALLEWRSTRQRRWLLVLAACTGWMAITRPLTAAAYAVPIAVVVLPDLVRGRRWRDMGAAFVVGSAIVAIMPLWSVMTIGQLRPTPYSLYSELYFPWDRMGFGRDTTPPARPLNADMQRFAQFMGPQHAVHTSRALPVAFVLRASAVIHDMVRPARAPLVVLGIIGVVASGALGGFALASVVAVLLAYLSFAHPAIWTVYYLETEVVGPYLCALGAWTVLAAVRERRRRPTRDDIAAMPTGSALAGLLLALPLLLDLRQVGPGTRAQHVRAQDYFRRVDVAASQLPPGDKIVFVRYSPAHSPHYSLIANDADLASSPVWWVYDRGYSENARLRAMAPGRAAYVMDERGGWIKDADHAPYWTPPPDLPVRR
jgi:hypothetical protein